MANSLHVSSSSGSTYLQCSQSMLEWFISGMHRNQLVTKLVMSEGLRKVGPRRAKNLPATGQKWSIWRGGDPDGAPRIYRSTGEKSSALLRLKSAEKMLVKSQARVSGVWTSSGHVVISIFVSCSFHKSIAQLPKPAGTPAVVGHVQIPW